MTTLMYVNVGLAVVNTLLALVLGWVYWRNHREIGSPFTLGLLLFAAFLLFDNGLTLYHFYTMMPKFASVGEGILVAESLLQTGALSALTYATLR